MRLGVSAAMVDGVRVEGDVEVDPDTGTVAAVALSGRRGVGVACPGLVDLQVNGYAGVDFRDAEPEAILDAAVALARRGVTAFCPTLHAQSPDAYERSLRTLEQTRRLQSQVVLARGGRPGSRKSGSRQSGSGQPGARLLGAHLEGPFLARERHGAHDPDHLRDPDPELLQRLLAAGSVAMMTLSPELDGAIELIAALHAAGLVASLGHTGADAATVRAALETGARHITHLWNAQSAPTARHPGVIGVALSDDSVTVGLIADRRHVSAEIIEVTLRCCEGRIAATSDAIAEAEASGVRATGTTMTAGSSDVLRGGLVAIDTCLRHLVEAGLSLSAALDACGAVQRSLLGEPAVRLRPGEPADIVVLDDALQPTRTIIGGRQVTS